MPVTSRDVFSEIFDALLCESQDSSSHRVLPGLDVRLYQSQQSALRRMDKPARRSFPRVGVTGRAPSFLSSGISLTHCTHALQADLTTEVTQTQAGMPSGSACTHFHSIQDTCHFGSRLRPGSNLPDLTIQSQLLNHWSAEVRGITWDSVCTIKLLCSRASGSPDLFAGMLDPWVGGNSSNAPP